MGRILAVGLIGLCVTLAPLLLSCMVDPAFGDEKALWSSILINVGTALLLTGALFLLERGFLARVRATAGEGAAAAVEPLTARVELFEQQVEQRLSAISEEVEARLAEEQERDHAAFDMLRETPNLEVVREAMARAIDQHLVSTTRPPRVLVAPGHSRYVSIHMPTRNVFGHHEVVLQIETIAGASEAEVSWSDDLTTSDVMVELARALRIATQETFSPEPFFNGLADLLEVADRHPDHRPAIELVPPQWVVTTEGLSTYDQRYPYTVKGERLRSNRINIDIGEKTWSDLDSFESALSAWHALNPNNSSH